MARLYFHETLDPVRAPGAHTRYLDELGEVVRSIGNAEGSAGAECIAAWVPIFLTGEWPRIVTFWEMPGGWDGFANHFDHYQELFHGPLERWYGERSGGFDRVLVGTAFTPGREEMMARKRRAPVVLQQLIGLRTGTADAYLALLAQARTTIDANCDFTLLGAYQTAFRHGTEVMVLWAFPDVRTLAQLEARPDEFPAYSDWLKTSRELEVTHNALVMRPTVWSPLR